MSEYAERTFTTEQDSPPRSLLLTYGLLSLLLGLALLAWPGETLRVVGWLIALQLLFGGATQLFLALVPSGLCAPMRILWGVAGLLALAVGTLCLFSPFQTLSAVSMLFGAWLVVAAVAELVMAFVDSGAARRTWDVVRGVLSGLAGSFLLLNPERSLELLVLVVTVWLVGFGLVTVVSAVRHPQAESRSAASAPRHHR